jgi:hypothetical protein
LDKDTSPVPMHGNLFVTLLTKKFDQIWRNLVWGKWVLLLAWSLFLHLFNAMDFWCLFQKVEDVKLDPSLFPNNNNILRLTFPATYCAFT